MIEKIEPAEDERVFLVVVDETEEMRVALRFASRRAEHTGGRVAMLAVLEPAEFQHWAAVGDLMRAEAREGAETRLTELSQIVNNLTGKKPILHVREGSRRDELVKLLEEDENISVLVLAAGTGSEGPGPLIRELVGKRFTCPVPITIVPGGLSDEKVDMIT